MNIQFESSKKLIGKKDLFKRATVRDVNDPDRIIITIPTLNKHHNNYNFIKAFHEKLLETQEELSDIYISNNTYSDSILRTLLEAIHPCINLTTLDCRKAFMSHQRDEFQKLCFSIHNFKQLIKLDLSGNHLGESQMAELSEAIENINWLKDLSLDHNRIGPVGAASLADGLRNSILHVEILSVRSSNLGNAGVIELCPVFEKMKSLRELYLSENEISKGGISAVSKILETNDALNTLDLSDNFLNEEGTAEILKYGLEELENLEILMLGDCCLGNEGVGILLKGYKNRKLKDFSISHNDINRKEVTKKICRFIEKGARKLEYINLVGNDIDEELVEKLRTSLGRKKRRIIIDTESLSDMSQDEEYCSILRSEVINYAFGYV